VTSKTTKTAPRRAATKPARTRASAPTSRTANKVAPVAKAGPTKRKAPAATRAKPHGREEVIESILDATVSLWTAKGTADLTLRSIASRANVNYGLVHRHFGTKEAVIRAALHRVVARSLTHIEHSSDLVAAIDDILPLSTGAHSRLLAWSVLQYVIDDVMPEENSFLTRMKELAANDLDQSAPDAELRAGVLAASVLALLYGWRLFEPYLIKGLGLENLSHAALNQHLHESLLRVMSR
jgi:TetR/AcrR family transcriptional regulator, repressor for neighboring sulfatase